MTRETDTPLLSSEKEDSVETLLNRFRQKERTLMLQSEQSRSDEIEHRLKAERCATKGDAVGARHYLGEAIKSAYYYDSELKQKENVTMVYRKLREAVINAETVKSFSAANMTLEQLQKEIPLEKLDDIMETLTDNTITVRQQSETLATPFILDTKDVDAELKELFDRVKLPDVPTSIPQGVAQKSAQLLKSE